MIFFRNESGIVSSRLLDLGVVEGPASRVVGD